VLDYADRQGVVVIDETAAVVLMASRTSDQYGALQAQSINPVPQLISRKRCAAPGSRPVTDLA
jgi:hypothetical protein